MSTSISDWNYDRIVTAKAQITQAIVDMDTILHRGEANLGQRRRMVEYLHSAADDIEQLRVKRGE
jgi:hypothetical protein